MKKDFTLPLNTRKKLIIEALRKGTPVKCARLQEICGDCSDKSIRRTVDKLRDDRWPIESSNDGYYLTKASSSQKQVTQDTHFGVLMIAGCSIDKNIGKLIPGVGSHIKKEIFKLQDVEETEDSLLVDRCIDAPQSIYSIEQIESFGKIARSIVDELAISFEYTNVWKHESETRSIFPIQLKLKNGIWYLLSWDLDRDAMRVFKLPKIQNIRTADIRWMKPSVDSIDSVLKSSQFSIWDRGEDPLTVRINVEGHAKDHVENYDLAPKQKIIREGDLTVLEIETSDIIGLLSWCRHYIHNITILYPEELKQRFLDDLQIGLDRHSIAHNSDSTTR